MGPFMHSAMIGTGEPFRAHKALVLFDPYVDSFVSLTYSRLAKDFVAELACSFVCPAPSRRGLLNRSLL